MGSCRNIAYLSLYRGYRYVEDRCIGHGLLYWVTKKKCVGRKKNLANFAPQEKKIL